MLPGQDAARESGMMEASTIESSCEPKKSLLGKIVGPFGSFGKRDLPRRQDGHSRKAALNTTPEREAGAHIFDVRKFFDV